MVPLITKNWTRQVFNPDLHTATPASAGYDLGSLEAHAPSWKMATIPARRRPRPTFRDFASLDDVSPDWHALLALPTVLSALSTAVYVFLSPHVA
jgi:hypothetical protein